MALGNIQVGAPYDFNRMQALNLVFHSSVDSSPPSTPVEGEPWWVTDLDVLRVYKGAAWGALVVGPASTTDGNIPRWNGTTGGNLNEGVSLVTTVGDPGADTAVPTEQAVREAIAAAIASEVSFKGGYNANTNTPDLDVSPSGVKAGDMYYVTVAGTFFTTPLEAGDVIIANIDDADAESEWTMVQKNLPSIIPVASGGTGVSSFTAYSLIASGTTTTGALTQIAETTQYKILFSGTAAAYPSWSPYTMPSTVAQYTMFYASSTSAIGTIAAAGTTGMFLRGTSGGAPAWSTLVLPNAATSAGYIMRASGTNTIGMSTATYPDGATTTGAFMRVSGSNVWSESTLVLPNAASGAGYIMRSSASNTIAMSTATFPDGATGTGTFLRTSAANTWQESTLVLPNAATSGQLMRASASNTISMTSLTMPATITALSIFVANSANILTEVTATANQSIRMNSGGTAWEAYTPSASNHNLLSGTHSDSVTQTVSRGSLIYGNSTPAWDELVLQASGASGYVLATDANDVAWKKQRYVEKLSTSATSYDVVHNLGTRRVMVLCQDTTNNQNIFVDWCCKSGAENTTITVYFGTAPSSNTRIVTVFGINYGAALDTAN
jgi:hypothetical protein